MTLDIEKKIINLFVLLLSWPVPGNVEDSQGKGWNE